MYLIYIHVSVLYIKTYLNNVNYMAILSSTSPLCGVKGLLGGLMFRTIDGKTVVSTYNKPDRRRMKRKETELQRIYRSRFAEAARYAKEAVSDIDTYEYYKRKAKKLGVPNAYTAAITDFMRKGTIDKIDTSKFEKKGEIVVKAEKKNLDFVNVTLRVATADGDTITQAKAIRQANGLWSFRYPGTPPRLSEVKLYVEAHDRVGHVVCKEAA